MSKNTSITLGDHFDTFIATQLETGRYASASEIVRAGLRMLEDTEARLGSLRRMLDEGEQSEFVEYSLTELISELDSETE